MKSYRHVSTTEHHFYTGVAANTWNSGANTSVCFTNVSTRPCGAESIHCTVLCPSGHSQTCRTVAILLHVSTTWGLGEYLNIVRTSLPCICMFYAPVFHIYARCLRMPCKWCLHNVWPYLSRTYIHYANAFHMYAYWMRKPFIYMSTVCAYLSHTCTLYAQAFHVFVYFIFMSFIYLCIVRPCFSYCLYTVREGFSYIFYIYLVCACLSYLCSACALLSSVFILYTLAFHISCRQNVSQQINAMIIRSQEFIVPFPSAHDNFTALCVDIQ